MNLNWRSGLFRLWLISSIVFVLMVSIIGYSPIRDKFAGRDEYWRVVNMQKKNQAAAANPTSGNIFDTMPTGLERYLTDEEVGIQAPDPWNTIEFFAALALVPPLVLLIFGRMMIWALSGFTRKING